MHNAAPAPTKAEQDRIDKFRWIGCVVCHVFLRRRDEPYDVHHLVEGNKRLGHAFTIPLCPWHHRGLVPLHLSAYEMRERYGPSKARNPREFAARYGSDRELVQVTDRLIEEFKQVVMGVA